MSVVLWLLVVAGMGVTYFLLYSQQKTRYDDLAKQYRTLHEQYETYRKASYQLTVAMPPEHDDDARAVQNYKELAEQYKAMIDELYEFGEQIVQRHR